jgi:hypothetical protein
MFIFHPEFRAYFHFLSVWPHVSDLTHFCRLRLIARTSMMLSNILSRSLKQVRASRRGRPAVRRTHRRRSRRRHRDWHGRRRTLQARPDLFLLVIILFFIFIVILIIVIIVLFIVGQPRRRFRSRRAPRLLADVTNGAAGGRARGRRVCHARRSGGRQAAARRRVDGEPDVFYIGCDHKRCSS